MKENFIIKLFIYNFNFFSLFFLNIVLKELEKLNKNLEAICIKSPTQSNEDKLLKYNQKQSNDISSSTTTATTTIINDQNDKNLLLNDIKICLNQIKNNFQSSNTDSIK
jgi:hypothetical protein